jgi:hypothetical protein
MEIVISIIALIISIIGIAIHYKDSARSKYDRILNLQSRHMNRLLTIKQRLKDILLDQESMRIILRSKKDSKEKYDVIEELPGIISTIKSTIDKIENIANKIKDLKIKEIKYELLYQSLGEIELEINMLEAYTDNLDNDNKKILDKIEKIPDNET